LKNPVKIDQESNWKMKESRCWKIGFINVHTVPEYNCGAVLFSRLDKWKICPIHHTCMTCLFFSFLLIYETRPNDFDSAVASLMLSRFLFVKFHKFVSEPF
jgi:hypothetical protein